MDNNRIIPSKLPILNTRQGTFVAARLPLSTSWLLGDCMELRGKQDLWLQQKREMLRALREQAIIQSVESSNRIEGVTIAANRLRPIVLEKAKPRTRPEEELAGYRKALDAIFRRGATQRLETRILRELHSLAQEGAGDAGKFKSRDNEIIQITAAGQRVVRFRPTSAAATPHAIDVLCDSYNRLCENNVAPPLLLVATAVFDFLCIHPFRDGNGRVSRLLTTLLLQHHGFVLSRYVSLERLIEESKDEYYQVLEQCSRGWAEGSNVIVPWWNYFLAFVRRGYMEFASRVTEIGTPSGKSDLVRQVALRRTDRFTLKDMQQQFPQVSAALIKKILAALRDEGFISLHGWGRGAYWRRR